MQVHRGAHITPDAASAVKMVHDEKTRLRGHKTVSERGVPDDKTVRVLRRGRLSHLARFSMALILNAMARDFVADAR